MKFPNTKQTVKNTASEAKQTIVHAGKMLKSMCISTPHSIYTDVRQHRAKLKAALAIIEAQEVLNATEESTA